jgi:hypothetical protein
MALYEVVLAFVPCAEELLVLLTASVSGRHVLPACPAARRRKRAGSLNPSSSLGRCTAWIVFDEPLDARPLVDDDKSLVTSCHGLDRRLFMPWMEDETVVLRANCLILSNRHLDVRLAANVAGVTVAALTEKLEERLFAIVVGFLGSLVDLLDPLVYHTNECLVSSCSVETSIHSLLRFLACARTRENRSESAA